MKSKQKIMKKVHQTIKCAITFFNPYKSFNFFIDYLNKLETISSNPFANPWFGFLFTILIYEWAHLTYLYLSPSLSICSKLINSDVLYTLIPKRSFNLIWSLGPLQAIYQFKMLYFSYNKKVIKLVQNIIVRKDVSFFVSPNYKNMPVYKYLKKFYLANFNSFYFTITFLGK